MTFLGFERRWLLTVFDTVAPSGVDERVPGGASSVPMERFLDDLIANAPMHFLLGLKACVWVVMFAPLFVLGRFATFQGLSPRERLELLERFGRSDTYVIREMPLLFKTVACLGFCGVPEIQSRVGIHPVDATAPAWARRGLPMEGGRP
jgi:hypothetical protein